MPVLPNVCYLHNLLFSYVSPYPPSIYEDKRLGVYTIFIITCIYIKGYGKGRNLVRRRRTNNTKPPQGAFTSSSGLELTWDGVAGFELLDGMVSAHIKWN